MLKMGMVGGGPGSMIGDVHRVTALAKNKAEFVCGCFSSEAQKNNAKGKALGLDSARVYDSVEDMIAGELKRGEGDRMDFVAITTPNHLHVTAALKFVQAGFHVMCDKPLGISLGESLELKKAIQKAKIQFGMTYTYRGYSAIQRIGKMVREGELGTIRKVLVDYSQGWLAKLVEKEDNKQALWRTDPKYSGAGGTIADIGTHAFNLAEYVAGSNVTKLAAQVSTLVDGRNIDDDANTLVQFENGAVGAITVGQALTGEENSLRVQVYGSEGAVVWNHSNPDELITKVDGTIRNIIISISQFDTDKVNRELSQKHAGSFLKGFIDIYDSFIDSISNNAPGTHPTIEDGVRGMLYIEKAIESSKSGKWVELKVSN